MQADDRLRRLSRTALAQVRNASWTLLVLIALFATVVFVPKFSDESVAGDTDSRVLADPDTVGDGIGGANALASGQGGIHDPSSPTAIVAGNAGEGTKGIARSGADCSKSPRQLGWSSYGPACRALFTGSNGGETWPGVTKDKITLTFRIGVSGSSAVLFATGGSATDSLGGDQQAFVSDLRVLIDYFNRQFELYGRKVELKVFEGQGDFLAEFQGRRRDGAQADAARAKDLGAFADISMITQTQPYAEALIANRIIALSPVYLSQGWYEQHAPFAYSIWPAGTFPSRFMGNTVCEGLADRAASRAGGDLRNKKRVFGMIHPENPEYSHFGDVVAAVLEKCGQRLARRIAYALDISTASQEHANAIAQLRDAGVTTVICGCDEFSPLFLTRSADEQRYDPEWLALWWPDPWFRLASQRQWSNAFLTEGATVDHLKGEAGRAYRQASGGKQPQAPAAISLAYQQLMLMFSALQSAGPELTPSTVASGFASLPSTTDGDFGPWEFGPGLYTPTTHFRLGWWDPQHRSALDGIAGASRNCGLPWVRFDDAGAFGSAGEGLGCFR